MRIQLERVKNIGRKIGLNDEKGYAVAIFLALVIVSALVAAYYLEFRPQPEPYNTIYLLDSQKKAVDYPVALVANQNSTFNVWVGVVNNMGGRRNQTYQVLIKVTPNLLDFPVNTQPIQTYDISLANGASWQTLAAITQNQVGNYSVVFELWHQNSAGAYEFTNDYSVLNIQVVS
ncbi:DUF1616 domain-containing protein [Candidatus Bathyarchaeota archaeon]|nr:DUF1616 domain-containing protein [Candidatus Bathyarchaeota archaeon]